MIRTLAAAVLACVSLVSVAVAQNYQIRPGDVLSVEVLQDPSLNREVLVLPDGSISFPFAGNLPVSGRNTNQVQDLISQGIASNFAVEPNVFVTVRQLNAPTVTGSVGPSTIDIYFVGETGTPGVVAVPHGTTLLQALALGGGFTNFAAQRRIQLRRTNSHTGETSVVTLNYRALSDGGILSNDPVLADGDVILVPERRLFE
ncbi:MAG: polysaccharide biosynthesis/export family protein [Pseudomonadota bacterium]